MPREIEVTCTACGSKQAFTAWQSLNASLNPDAREALLKGELTRFTCAKCGSSTEVVYPLLYHDINRKLMIWLGGSKGALETGALPVTASMRDYQFRVVTTWNQLIEKIRIFESGLDDRLLEFAKFLLCRGATNAGRTLIGELRYKGQGKIASGEEAIQFVLLAPGGPEQFTFLMSHLGEIAREVTGKFPSSEPESAKWITVDEKYAAGLANEF